MTEPTDPTEPSADSAEALTSEAEAALTEALLCAYRPAALDSDVNEALIELALESPLRPASDEERAESERFRRALEGRGEHPDLGLVQGLLEAHRTSRSDPPHLAELSDRALDRALGRAPVRVAAPTKKGNVIFVSFGVVTALAAAAAVLLVVLFPTEGRTPSAAAPAAAPAGAMVVAQAPPLTQSRSAEALFDGKFERDHTTERVDRIASVRARELRQNRFQQWGVPGP